MEKERTNERPDKINNSNNKRGPRTYLLVDYSTNQTTRILIFHKKSTTIFLSEIKPLNSNYLCKLQVPVEQEEREEREEALLVDGASFLNGFEMSHLIFFKT